MSRAVVLAAVLVAGCSHASRSAPALPELVAGPELDAVDRTRDPGCASRWAAGVVGRVVDEAGAPMSGIVGQACVLGSSGRRVCLVPSETRANGVFTVVVPMDLRCAEDIALRVFDRSGETATMYAIADAPDRDGVVFASDDVVMFALDPADALPPAGDTSASRTVPLGPFVALRVAPDALESYEDLAARVLADDEPAPGHAVGLDTVVAIGPEQAVVDGAVTLRIATGLAPGAHAEILVLGGLYTTRPDGEAVEEARWERLTVATVAPDGSVSTDGTAVSALGWFAVRALTP